MRIKQGRIAAIVLLLILLGALAALLFDRLERLSAAANEAMAAAQQTAETEAAHSALASDIRFHAEHGAGQLALLFVQGEQQQRVAIYGEMDMHSAAIDRAIARIKPLLASDEEKMLLARLMTLRETFRDNLQDTVDALELDDREKAETLLATVTRSNLQELRAVVAQLVKAQLDSKSMRQQQAQDRRMVAQTELSRSRNITIGLGLAALLAGLLLGALLLREPAVSRPG